MGAGLPWGSAYRIPQGHSLEQSRRSREENQDEHSCVARGYGHFANSHPLLESFDCFHHLVSECDKKVN